MVRSQTAAEALQTMKKVKWTLETAGMFGKTSVASSQHAFLTIFQ